MGLRVPLATLQNSRTTSFRKTFSSTCAAGRKKVYAESNLVFLWQTLQPNGIPHKIAFPRLKAGKAIFAE
jgi:hypothetical protein